MKDFKPDLDAFLEDKAVDYDEDGNEGYYGPYSILKDFFSDKEGSNFKHVGYDEMYNGRHAYPPFTEIYLFEVYGQLHLIEGESSSWEGQYALYDFDTLRPVEKSTKTIEVTDYVTVR